MTLEGSVEDAAFVMALRGLGVRDTDTLRAMERVPRARFAPREHRDLARRDIALPLPCGQTMSAPTVVAAMLTALKVRPGARILEIGTGSGYVTTLLIRLGAASILSVERYATLAEDAVSALDPEDRVVARVEVGDGLDPASSGEGGFDRILVNGTLPALPVHLAAALAPGGRLVGGLGQGAGSRLVVVERDRDGGTTEALGDPLRLAPLTHGRAFIL
ncbi:protein-L-isoaspartate O-methyltransferase family protein [Methylobacterium marchantiae]|uniref:Protein-L-isoaspartate O-methyltransferase n=1 Tax=Methylobacterium marchantiae TaxID=600331 RepID=A0ABW3X3E8_9HYPH|nr:Protein-L-isoaspartate O-methyltransferase [Methylobacterium marchantiae]